MIQQALTDHLAAAKVGPMKALYWVSTGLLSAMFLSGAGMYVFNNAGAAESFASLGFPSWMIYPLAIAKILAVVAILSRRSKFLLEWAYAGLFFNVSFAAAAHLVVGDGEQGGALIGLALVITSYVAGGLHLGNAAFPKPNRG